MSTVRTLQDKMGPANGGMIMALRDTFPTAMKEAMKAGDPIRLSTVRMMMAALKDRDIDARGKGNPNGIDEGEIQRMLQGLVKQRREAAELYDKGGRPELASKERAEIAVIEGFLPKQLSDADAEAAIKALIAATGAQGVKDMGRVMAALKEKYSGQIDLSKAGAAVKRLLG